jgi:hypothetical protein
MINFWYDNKMWGEGTGGGTEGLAHAKEMLYHRATLVAPIIGL